MRFTHEWCDEVLRVTIKSFHDQSRSPRAKSRRSGQMNVWISAWTSSSFIHTDASGPDVQSHIFAFRNRKASLSGSTVMFLSELSIFLRWYEYNHSWMHVSVVVKCGDLHYIPHAAITTGSKRAPRILRRIWNAGRESLDSSFFLCLFFLWQNQTNMNCCICTIRWPNLLTLTKLTAFSSCTARYQRPARCS